MKVMSLDIPDILLVEPKVFEDDRGFFYESFNKREWEKQTGLDGEFVQSNHARSVKGVLRGLHYQIRQAQGKLVRVVEGEVFDVAVDIRRSSATFGKWVGTNLSEKNRRSLYIPPGFAHGYVVLSDVAQFLYRTTDYYAPEHERCIRWDDPELAIDWHYSGTPILSSKDTVSPLFCDAEVYS